MTSFAPPTGPIEVSDGIFAWVQHDGTWWINNAGFLVADNGVIAVDACSTETRTRALLEGIRTVTSQPVRTLVNTHHHGDHTFGNYLFEPATIVGHERVRDGIRGWGQPRSAPFWTDVDWGEIRLSPPMLTFTEGVDLWVGDLRCEVRHLGHRAHTDNDSIVWITERRVLFTGDLAFNGGTPFLLQGSVTGARRTVDLLLALDPEVVVPGHGAVCGPEVLHQCAAYLDFVLETAASAREAGLTPLEAARETDLDGFAYLLDQERIVGNLYRAYADLEGRTDVDLAAALADMITFNGGPLTTHA
jgi:cyclase